MKGKAMFTSETAELAGRVGGIARRMSLTQERRTEIARNAGRARWAGKPRAESRVSDLYCVKQLQARFAGSFFERGLEAMRADIEAA
jgi:hypothetical protein